ncbi:MAG: hypothetical protein ACREOW_10255 [Thermodesulfobacteriota bacterium]
MKQEIVINKDQGLVNNTLNYLEHNIIQAYFITQEHIAYIGYSLARDFYPQLIKSLIKFIKLASVSGANETLDNAVFCVLRRLRNQKEQQLRNLKAQRLRNLKVKAQQSIQSDLINECKKVNPIGFDLLKIQPPINFDTLRKAYWNAAKIYHPDVGGKTKDMQIVNEAFTEFHEQITRFPTFQESDIEDTGLQEIHIEDTSLQEIDTDVWHECNSTLDYLCRVGELLVQTYEDIWAVDKAYYWLKVMEHNGWLNSDYAKKYETPGSNWVPTLFELASRLYAANMHKEAKDVFDTAQVYDLRCRRVGFDFEYHALKSHAIVNGEKKLRVILNHPFKAKNAFRLGIINNNRFGLVRNRFEREKREFKEKETFLNEFVSSFGFIQNLPVDEVTKGKTTNVKLIPPPGAQDGSSNPFIYHLSNDQQAEYLIAFSKKTNLKLVKKYVYVRMKSYLKSVIFSYDKVSIDDIIRECKLFIQLFSFSLTSFAKHIGKVIELFEFFKGLDSDKRYERLEILRQITRDKDEDGFILSEDDSILFGRIINSWSFVINPTLYFAEQVQLPIETLKMYLKTKKKVKEKD